MNEVHERAVSAYIAALETGDVAAADEVLLLAETDAVLADKLAEVDEIYAAEIAESTAAAADETILSLLRKHLPHALEDEAEPAPLTVADVASRLKTDPHEAALSREAAQVVARPETSRTPLPEMLNGPSVAALFQQIGVAVTGTFAERFRSLAIKMRMQQSYQTQMAAARKQTRPNRQPLPSTPQDEKEEHP